MNTIPVLVAKETGQQVLCCYHNATPQIQVARVFDHSTLCLERVIFPAEQFLFEASPDADLEIYCQDSSGILLEKSTRCSELQVKD